MPKPIRLAVVAPGEPLPCPFAIGEQVHLKSGGPILTVETPGPEWTACRWFDDCGVSACETFRNATLVRFVPNPPRRKPTSRSR